MYRTIGFLLWYLFQERLSFDLLHAYCIVHTKTKSPKYTNANFFVPIWKVIERHYGTCRKTMANHFWNKYIRISKMVGLQRIRTGNRFHENDVTTANVAVKDDLFPDHLPCTKHIQTYLMPWSWCSNETRSQFFFVKSVQDHHF